MAAGKQPAEVAVAALVFHQAYRPPAVPGIADFRAHDRDKAFTAAGPHKRPQAAEIIGIGQGEMPVTQLPGGPADLLDRGRAPHERIAGPDG